MVGVTRAAPLFAGWSPAGLGGLLFSIRRLFTALSVSSTVSSRETKFVNVTRRRDNILNVVAAIDGLMETCGGSIDVVAAGMAAGWCSTIGSVSFEIGAMIGVVFSRFGIFETVG